MFLPLQMLQLLLDFLLLGDCDFERNKCTWYNARVGDNFDWITGSGGTSSSFTGPSADHNGNRTGNHYHI